MSDHEPVAPRLPEHYRAEKISGMMPDQIIFPVGTPFDIDATTGVVYVELDHKLSASEVSPSYFGNDRTALMKVLYVEDGAELEGYIADLRHLAPGGLYEKKLTFTEDMTDSDRAYTESLNRTHVPLLGAVFEDVDGNEIYLGDPRLLSHAARLAVELDNLEETLDSSVKSAIEQRIAALAVGDDHTSVDEAVGR